MRKIWLIAKREYLYNFKKKSFLFSAFGVPILIIGLWIVSFTLAEQSTSSMGGVETIGYVDLADVIAPEAAIPEGFVAYDTAEAAEAAYLDGAVDVYFVITENYWNDGLVQTYSPYALPEGVEDEIGAFLRTNVLTHVNSDYVERLSDPMRLDLRMAGNLLAISEDSAFLLFLMPLAFAMVFMFATTITSQFLMQSVTEEKENRVMEILVTSSTPEQMLAGKVLGLGGLGLTQILVYGVALAVIVMVSDPMSPVAQLLRLPPLLLLLVLVYFVLGYLFFGAIMAGIGASVTAEQEGRQVAGLFTFIIVIPLVLSFIFFQDPNGPLPVLLSLIPFTAPVAMLFRLPLAAIPTWQFVLSLAILVVSTAFAVWVSARVFRLGMLMYGKRLRLRDILGVLRPGAGPAAIQTVAAGTEKRGA
ncbi:MAG: ABC transporter permease [Anaerolineae bacterium]